MMRPLLLGLLMALPSGAAPAALRDVAVFRQGMEALDSELWDIADQRFEQTLLTPDLSAADKRKVEWRRLEAWIRGDRSAAALAKLAEPAFANDPETYFWKAQALAGLGRFREAVDALAPALENAKALHRNEALLTRASLQLSLNDEDGASATLDALSKSGDAKMVRLARLRQTGILIDEGRIAEARKLLPDAKTLDNLERPEQAYLDARLLLAEGKYDAAASAFAILQDQPEGQSRARYDAAVIGYADALKATDNVDGAVKALLDEVAKQKDSPMVDAIFRRIEQWLPETPAANDPILDRLALWSPEMTSKQDSPVSATVQADKTKDTSGAANGWPVAPLAHPDELAPFALYTRAIGTYRQGTPEAREKAFVLMERLRLDYPRHFLAARALLQIARWQLAEGRTDRAFAALDAVRQSASLPSLAGEASFLKARASFDQGHPEAAAELFDQAAAALPDGGGETATLNAALARLQGGAVIAIPHSGDAKRDARVRADLELERGLATLSAEARQSALARFIDAWPDHPRNGEARIAAATAALHGHPPDSVFAREQVDAILSNGTLKKAVPAEEVAWLRVQIADQTEKAADAVNRARAYLATYQEGTHRPDAWLMLGRNLFRNGDYYQSRIELEKLAASAPASPLAPAALMLAARAAALGATDQSREESLGLFDRVAKGASALAPLARLEHAQLLITLKRFDATIGELQPWFQSMKTGEPLKIECGLLLGEALYAQGTEKPGSLAAALAVYDQLLLAAKEQPAIVHRLHYLRGMVLEQLPHPTVAGATREGDALESYVSVLQAADDHPPAEWEWFERCGFRALALLEKGGKWVAAIKTAAKIASFKGPRAEEAADRAKRLRIEHFIWEE